MTRTRRGNDDEDVSGCQKTVVGRSRIWERCVQNINHRWGMKEMVMMMVVVVDG